MQRGRRLAGLPCCRSASEPALRVAGFRGVECSGESLLLAIVACTFPEAGLADTGRAVASDDVPVRVLTHEIINKKILSDDDVSFQPYHFRDVRNPPAAIAQSGGLNHDVNRSAQHLTDGTGGQGKAAHGDHRLDAREC